MNDQETKLSAPDLEAQAHSKKVVNYIKSIINERGPISFCEFMDYVLYAPGLGYYSVGTQKFGPQGDFVTAPEISPFFSRCLANYCIPFLKEKNANLFEFGAGTGIMAADMLLWLDQQQCLPEKYFIMELSADLRARQQDTLREKVPHLYDRIEWLDRLPKKPIKAIVLANEVLDAMPVIKFKIQQGEVLEYFVGYNEDHFEWLLENADEDLQKEVEKLGILERDGYESEINLAISPWLSVVSGILSQGEIVIIDYGFLAHEYYHPQRDRGTLKCHYRHHSLDDPLENVGIMDITAHVDFSAVSQGAADCGLVVKQFSTQAQFLLDNGLLELVKSNPTLEVSQQIKKLTSPTEMGEMFKVMTLQTKSNSPPASP